MRPAPGGAHRERRGGAGGPFGGPMGMGMPVQKAKNVRATLRRLIAYLRPHQPQLAVILLTAILSTVFAILGPKILGLATTRLFEGMMAKFTGAPGARVDFEYIGRILLILLGLYVISAAFSYLQQWIMAGVAQGVVLDLRRDTNHKLARLPLKYFDSRTHGEVLSRVTNDIDTISNTLQQSVTQLITSVVTIVGVLIMMLTINPVMTLIALVTIPLSFVATINIAVRSQKHFAGQQKALGELNGHVEEMYTGHRVVKAYGRERQSLEKFGEVNERLYDSAWRAQFMSGLLFPMMSFVNNIGYVLVCVVGGIYASRRLIEIGDLQAFIQYARQFSQPIAQTAQIANVIQSAIAAAERVFEVLDESEEEPDHATATTLPYPRGRVEFQKVTFGYKDDAPLFTNLDISIQPGQTAAIVGPTGAGKTTLVNLLMRFYEVQGGRITIDGTDIRDIKRADLHRMFGMVLQDTWLFNGTIRENIRYGREGASDDDVVRAAEAAHADHFIRTLPDGYDTILNEEASNISQGQRQLLTIARAILADPAILILDEATSSVDTRTEVAIQRAMLTLMRGRTSFVIAHRLSTIRDADLILVMNHGSVVEQGTHEQLLARRGFYADLYNSQFSDGGMAVPAA
ncbi:MAG TPA: ABC transporter ATP-binding protein [Deinococcales bacterium]|nr:ABC transporter ATP-binding protein [Deinococcales bacterium]